MSRNFSSRRVFLRGLLLGAASLPWLRTSDLVAAETLPPLALTDPTAVALGYTDNAAGIDASKEAAYKKGSTCSNCALYRNAEEQKGHAPCGAFPGKSVKASGWCRAWAAKS